MITLDKVLEGVEIGVLNGEDIAKDFLNWSDNDTLREIYNFYYDTDITRSEEDTEKMINNFYDSIEVDPNEWILNFGKWAGDYEFTEYIDYYLSVRDYPELENLI